MSEIDFSNVCLKPDEIDMVLYHGDCIDGFASAFACYYYFKQKKDKKKKKIIYIPLQYQKPPPMVDGKNILMCDFSFKYSTLKNILKSAKKLLILDHHQSAEKDLKNIPKENKIFRMDHSGAYITWAYFFGEESVPLMIRYVEDNDIWKRSMTNTRQFISYVANIPKQFDAYEQLLDDEYVTNSVIPMGDGMQRQNDNYINDGVKKMAVNFILLDNRLYFVGIVNTSILKSEIGNAFLISNPDVNFAICYSKNEYTGETYVSMRSTNTGSDVEEIASKFGGGGHRNAAGLSVYSADTIPSIQIDRYQCYNQIKNIKIVKQTLKGELDLNIVYLNSYHHKRHLGKYLLQKRYDEQIDDNIRSITEAVSIIRNKTKDPTYYIGIDIAIIYYYNDSEDYTYFSICSESLDILYMIKDLYQDDVTNTDDSNITTRLKIKLKGFKNII
jgi:oligoribonuclease NrnB/cAMP/cGMP phosphodiesterase (DHH superfamily)